MFSRDRVTLCGDRPLDSLEDSFDLFLQIIDFMNEKHSLRPDLLDAVPFAQKPFDLKNLTNDSRGIVSLRSALLAAVSDPNAPGEQLELDPLAQ